MIQNYPLFPELGILLTKSEIDVLHTREKRMSHYFKNPVYNRLKRQGTDATLLQKKKGLLPLADYCIKCKIWCASNKLQYHHVDEYFPYAVVPTCPICHKQLESLKIQTEMESIDRQIYLDQLFYHEIDITERDNRIYDSAAKSMMKGEFPYNHTVKLVINY